MNCKALFWIGLACVPLMGCAPSGEQELGAWMSDLRANTKPNVKPLIEPKSFEPENYVQSAGMDPFNPQKLTQALRRDSTLLASNAALIAPEMARRKELLESFPMDTMTMVGSLNKAGKLTALLKVEGLLYQVQVGNYLGQNYGKITRITETAIQVREIVQDSTGDWIERNVNLDLQEGSK